MDLANELAGRLEHLGETPEQVAVVLWADGVAGVRHTVRSFNPVVRYVRPVLPSDALDVAVDRGRTLAVCLSDGRRLEVPIPHASVQFLHDFNCGLYPELEDRTDVGVCRLQT
jgi:hypothetical protein